MGEKFRNTRSALRTMISFRNYRWAARLLGFTGVVLIASFMIGEGFPMIKAAKASYDLLFLLTLFTFSFFAYVVGWIIEIVGGALLTLAGLAIAVYISFSQVFTGTGYIFLLSVPFILPGILFLLSWRNKVMRMREASQNLKQ